MTNVCFIFSEKLTSWNLKEKELEDLRTENSKLLEEVELNKCMYFCILRLRTMMNSSSS